MGREQRSPAKGRESGANGQGGGRRRSNHQRGGFRPTSGGAQSSAVPPPADPNSRRAPSPPWVENDAHAAFANRVPIKTGQGRGGTPQQPSLGNTGRRPHQGFTPGSTTLGARAPIITDE